MSTLDKADVDVMKATKTCVAAHRFQYDYLNDDITADGRIDYTLTNKVPKALHESLKAGKKLLVLINPPYAAATNRGNTAQVGDAEFKSGVAKTRFAEVAMNKFGKASNELFTQFVARIALEFPDATLAMFSTLKYVNAPTLEIFRANWNATFLGGFVTHNKAFDGLTGNFPIGFLVWKTNQRKRIPMGDLLTEVLDRFGNPIGAKTFYQIGSERFLSGWIKRPKPNATLVIPLKNAYTPATATKDLRGTRWTDGGLACMDCAGNDLQHAEQHTVIFSSGFGSAGAFFITEDNLLKSSVVFAVRRLVKPGWLNDRDQFLQPELSPPADFQIDCLIFMLFNRANRTASADSLEWNGRKWSIVNHFIPFTETEVNANDRFASDFMSNYLKAKTLSRESKAVLEAGRKLWQTYFGSVDPRSVVEELKLGRADVGWYQVRNALALRNARGDGSHVNFTPFEAAYDALTNKLAPYVFSLGFLKT